MRVRSPRGSPVYFVRASPFRYLLGPLQVKPRSVRGEPVYFMPSETDDDSRTGSESPPSDVTPRLADENAPGPESALAAGPDPDEDGALSSPPASDPSAAPFPNARFLSASELDTAPQAYCKREFLSALASITEELSSQAATWEAKKLSYRDVLARDIGRIEAAQRDRLIDQDGALEALDSLQAIANSLDRSPTEFLDRA
jgi:hypothetical protein